MRRIHSLDIETEKEEGVPLNITLSRGSSPIQMIGCYDFFKNKFYSFFYHKNVKINQKEIDLLSKRLGTKNFNATNGLFNSPESGIKWDCLYLDFDNEKTMLESYIKFIIDTSPDIWNGFFIKTFDLVYIINRCKTLGTSYSGLSPLKNVYISDGEANIQGSIIYDIPDTYAKFMGSHRHANSLKKVSETHLKRDDEHKITKTSESIINESWYEDDWDKFKEYCLVDVELCVLLEKKLGLIDMCDRYEKFTGVNPRYVLSATSIIESFFNMIKPIYEKEVLNNDYRIQFKTKEQSDMRRESGGLVLKSYREFYRTGTVIILDLSKEYPSIIESLNISIETLVEKIIKDELDKYIHCIANNKYYKKEPIGFVPFSLKTLYKIRDQIERERDSYPYGSKEYNDMNKKRQTVKDSINAVSGQFDFATSIISKEGIADSVRGTGRIEIIISKNIAEKFGMITIVKIKVIYGDTDSIFVWLKNVNDWKTAKLVADEIVKWIQKGFDKLAKDMNIEEHKFEIALEKILDVFLSTGKKKKYFGHVLWADGKEVSEENSFYIRGYESRRSDSSEFTERAQKEIFSLICRVRQIGWNKVRRQILYKLRTEYPSQFNEDNLLEIGIPKRLKKPFSTYKVTNPHLEGAIFANKYLGANFDAGSKPKLIYIKEVKNNSLGIPYTNALCVEEGMNIPEGVFVVDKDLMFEKTISKKLQKTLDVIGIEKTEIESEYKQQKLTDLFKKKLEVLEQINDKNIDIVLKASENELKNWVDVDYE